MSLTYSSYLSQIAYLTVYNNVSDSNFTQMVPGMIDYAEQRCYRELDLLSTVTRVNGTSTTSRTFSYPSHFIVTQEIRVIDGSGNGLSSCLPISKEAMDFLYPNMAATGVPQYFAMLTDQQILLGPPPNQSYGIQVVGTIRPTPISPSNTTTFLSTYLPDLFVAASMVYASGALKNFGGQADDPKMAQSWESQYTELFKSANSEELRKKFTSEEWSSQTPSVMAKPQRN